MPTRRAASRPQRSIVALPRDAQYVPSIDLLESEALKRLIDQQIAKSREPIWRQVLSLKFVGGASAVVLIVSGLLGWGAMRKPVVEAGRNFLELNDWVSSQIGTRIESIDRTAYNGRVVFGADGDIRFVGSDCDVDAVGKLFSSDKNFKLDGCPVFVNKRETANIPFVAFPNQYIHIDFILAQRQISFDFKDKCNPDNIPRISECFVNDVVEFPDIDRLLVTIDDERIKMVPGLESLPKKRLDDGKLRFSTFHATYKMPAENLTLPTRRMVFLDIETDTSKEVLTNSTIYIVIHVTYQPSLESYVLKIQ